MEVRVLSPYGKLFYGKQTPLLEDEDMVLESPLASDTQAIQQANISSAQPSQPLRTQQFPEESFHLQADHSQFSGPISWGATKAPRPDGLMASFSSSIGRTLV